MRLSSDFFNTTESVATLQEIYNRTNDKKIFLKIICKIYAGKIYTATNEENYELVNQLIYDFLRDQNLRENDPFYQWQINLFYGQNFKDKFLQPKNYKRIMEGLSNENYSDIVNSVLYLFVRTNQGGRALFLLQSLRRLDAGGYNLHSYALTLKATLDSSDEDTQKRNLREIQEICIVGLNLVNYNLHLNNKRIINNPYLQYNQTLSEERSKLQQIGHILEWSRKIANTLSNKVNTLFNKRLTEIKQWLTSNSFKNSPEFNISKVNSLLAELNDLCQGKNLDLKITLFEYASKIFEAAFEKGHIDATTRALFITLGKTCGKTAEKLMLQTIRLCIKAHHAHADLFPIEDFIRLSWNLKLSESAATYIRDNIKENFALCQFLINEVTKIISQEQDEHNDNLVKRLEELDISGPNLSKSVFLLFKFIFRFRMAEHIINQDSARMLAEKLLCIGGQLALQDPHMDPSTHPMCILARDLSAHTQRSFSRRRPVHFQFSQQQSPLDPDFSNHHTNSYS